MGSKGRYAKYILPIILKDRRQEQWYVEPFVGAFNIIDKVDGLRLANDINPYIIALYKAVQAGWEPPDTLTKEEYQDIRFNKDKYPKHLVGFVGFGCSFGGKWFGGYAQDKEQRNYCAASKRSVLKQAANLKDVVIENKNYWEITIPPNSIVYCDPPYENTTKYKTKNPFDHARFWDWVRVTAKEGHTVFVSEYNAPVDFECVWSKTVNNTLTQIGSQERVEKLFKFVGGG